MPTTRLTVTSTESRTPTLRRVWFHSDDLSAFADSEHTDRYVKLVFPKPGVEYPDGYDLRQIRHTMPAEDLPVVRTYTALFPDVVAGTMAIDFVVHGDTGVAGPWAVSAQPGDELLANGPGGGYRPDPGADWHLLVGDESALPAITASLAVLDDDADVEVIALVDSPEHEPHLPRPANARVLFVHREAGRTLLDAVRSLDWRPGRVHAFVHGEADETMQQLRPHLFDERGLDRDQVSISGYWRRGTSEEGFREWKAAGRSGQGRRVRTV